jgi:apolipoprotein N-acyltransferase
VTSSVDDPTFSRAPRGRHGTHTRGPVATAATWWRILGAITGGLLLVASFPPYDWTWLAVPALAMITVSWHGARVRVGLLLGLLTGIAFFGIHVKWINVIGDDAWTLLTLFCAAWIALLAAAVAGTSRLRWWPLVVPLLWVAEEAARDRVPLGGFPWGRLAFGQTSTTLTPYAAVAGAPGVTFATALAGALLAWGALSWDRRPPWRQIGALAGVAVVCTAGLLIPLPTQGQSSDTGPAYLTAAVIQGDVPDTGLDAFGQRAAVLDNHVRVTEQLAAQVAAGKAPQPELVVWPENASDLDPYANPDARALIQQAVDAIKAPVLVGAVVADPDDPNRVLNVGIVWGPVNSADPGPGDFYAKQHPVPFGEWVPWRSVLTRYIGRFDLVPRDFAPGTRTGVLQLGPARIGNLICFEVAYDDLGRNAVTGAGTTGALAGLGGRILTVQTNNATYGLTGQPEQQVAMSQLRAVEHGRAVLVAATSGISAVISPDGKILDQLPEFTPGTIDLRVPLRDTLTIADRVGAWPEWIATAAGLAAVAGACLGGLRRRRGADVGSPTPLPIQERVP